MRFKILIYITSFFILILFLLFDSHAQSNKVFKQGFNTGVYHNYKIYTSFADLNFRLICMDTSGNVVWNRGYGDVKEDRPSDVYYIMENSMEYLIWTGFTRSFEQLVPPLQPHLKGYVIKTNLMGDTIWTRIYDRSGNLGFCLANDSNYIFTTDNGYGTVIKVDRTTGDTLWTTNNDWMVGIQNGLNNNVGTIYNSGDGFYITGTTFPVYWAKIKLMKTDTLGHALWVKAYGDTTANIGYNLTRCSNGDFILVGGTAPNGLTDDTLSYHDFNVLRVNSQGDTVWTRRYCYMNWTDYPKHAVETNDGGILIAGYTRDPNSSAPVKTLLIKTDSMGHVQWSKLAEGREPYSLSKTPDGFFMANFGIEFFDSLGNNCGTQDVQVLETYSQITIDSIVPIPGSGIEFFMHPPTQEYTAITNVTDYCLSLGVSDMPEVNELKIYPNPAFNMVTCELPVNNKESWYLYAYDFNGRRQIQLQISSSENKTIDISNWNNGLYFFMLENGSGKSYSKKIMVQH